MTDHKRDIKKRDIKKNYDVSIENFKAFGKVVNVPVRPITLIFGENSAGKSSILHSLLFLNQMRYQPQDKLADITYTKVGGNSVDLGGIPQLKYKQNNDLGLDFRITEQTKSIHFDDNGKIWQPFEFTFAISFSASNQLKTIDYIFNGLPLASLHSFTYIANTNRFVLTLDVNLDNFIECLRYSFFKRIIDFYLNNSGKIGIKTARRGRSFSTVSLINYLTLYSKQNSFIRTTITNPFLDLNANVFSQLQFRRYSEVECHIHSSDNSNLVDSKLDYVDEFDNSFEDIFGAFWSSFSKKFNEIASIFNDISYLGPIRTIPTRNFDTLDSIARDPSTGSTAWERLASDLKTREGVNKWLLKFGTKKEITTERLIETAQIRKLISNKLTLQQLTTALDNGTLSSRHLLRFYDREVDIFLSHRDMGVGVSQVLPVIVNCIANQNTTVLMEQPELHLHPRLQGDLADLFIDTAVNGKQQNTYLIETHSEHIIRRIMRRIREDRHKSDTEKRITKDDVAILYVAAGPTGSTVTQLRLDDEGDLIDEWPNGFFEEGFRDDIAGR